jgi:hypothetical protein
MIMKKWMNQNLRLAFYSIWFLAGFIQLLFTQVQDDEAYYWVYAKFLDWGYFDHPPMTALVIKVGGLFFGGVVGLRIIPLLLTTLTIFITEKIIQPANQKLFYAICLSVAVLQITGFWAVPDVPLVFFTALFFLCYKNFLQAASFRNIFLLGLTTACLMYSKYHGALVILFTLFSNLSLFKKWQTYAVGIVALLLFLPHLWWQYTHDWISIKFQLFERNDNRWQLSYTTDYILGQLLIAGPFAGVLFWIAAVKYKSANALERALKVTAIGFFVFFLLSSARGRVEANWTAPCLIPLIVLGYQCIENKFQWRKWLYRLCIATLIVTTAFRFIMFFNIIHVEGIQDRFHDWNGWQYTMQKKTQNHPYMVFSNSYQRASKYWFYTGQMTYSLNQHFDRRNNYNIWPVEDSLLGKPVYFMDIYNASAYPDSVKGSWFTVGYIFNSTFHSFAKVKLHTTERKYRMKETDSLIINASLEVSDYYKNYLAQHPEVDERILLSVFEGENLIKDIDLPISLQELIQTSNHRFIIHPPLPKGKYRLQFSIGADVGFTHNSDKFDLIIE